eukprot:353716-Chlamydomonas_euryale.AAC.12
MSGSARWQAGEGANIRPCSIGRHALPDWTNRTSSCRTRLPSLRRVEDEWLGARGGLHAARWRGAPVSCGSFRKMSFCRNG